MQSSNANAQQETPVSNSGGGVVNNNSNNNNTSSTATTLAPVQYLDKTGVTAHLREVMALLLESRPVDPFQFMAEYFKNVTSGTSVMSRSYRYVCASDRNKREFIENLTMAFNTLASQPLLPQPSPRPQQSLPTKSPRSNAKFISTNSTEASSSSLLLLGTSSSSTSTPLLPSDAKISAEELRSLVRMLCSDFPADLLDGILHILHLSTSMNNTSSSNSNTEKNTGSRGSNSSSNSSSNNSSMKQLDATDRTLINFAQFVSAVTTCLLYGDFLSQVEDIFMECGGERDGVLDVAVFEEQLKFQIEKHRELMRATLSDPNANHGSSSMNLPRDYHIAQVIEQLRTIHNESTNRSSNSGSKSPPSPGVTYDEFVMVMFHLIR